MCSDMMVVVRQTDRLFESLRRMEEYPVDVYLATDLSHGQQ